MARTGKAVITREQNRPVVVEEVVFDPPRAAAIADMVVWP